MFRLDLRKRETHHAAGWLSTPERFEKLTTVGANGITAENLSKVITDSKVPNQDIVSL